VGHDDKEQSVRPVVDAPDDVLLLVKLVTEPPPGSATRWSMEALGHGDARSRRADLGIAGVWRICSSLQTNPAVEESARRAPR
jgi:hypothetical protein